MRRLSWIVIACACVAGAAIWAISQINAQRLQIAPLMPDGALLYLEAKDLHALLNDWNNSEEKRTWLKGDNYAAFSRSRLFQRLSQAQDEFSTTASLQADNTLLSSIAGGQSALALYDIGNLEFVYVTRMDEHAVEATPLWQVRSKFEQRTEGSAQFFSRHDTQSNRTAAFAARDGWLVLGTREDLVAGVLDRIQGIHAGSLSSEEWFADAVKLATGPTEDLRMVLNLEKIVPSPYFRSYWVQRNITEMKQYRAALCDLHRSAPAYREDRFLLRKPNANARASGDVQALANLAPDDATWYAAQASPATQDLLQAMRENLLELAAAPERNRSATAPGSATSENAGSASMLEERIDVAPAIVLQSDPYQALRVELDNAQPAEVLALYTTRTAQDDMFVRIEHAMVIEAKQNWSQASVQSAITSALGPGLTASHLGLDWKENSSAEGSYFSIDGRVHLYCAAREKDLFLSTDAKLMEQLLARRQKSTEARSDGVTYASLFRHSAREQNAYRKLVNRLDGASHATAGGTQSEDNADSAEDQTPAFFSRNIGSLNRMFKDVVSESIQEKDQGAQVLQTVVYQWRHP